MFFFCSAGLKKVIIQIKLLFIHDVDEKHEGIMHTWNERVFLRWKKFMEKLCLHFETSKVDSARDKFFIHNYCAQAASPKC